MEESKEQVLTPDQALFERKKRTYFAHLALGVLSAMKLHKKAGLWETFGEPPRDFKMATRHSLVQIARVDVTAERLGLPDDISRDLSLAVALHDVDKRRQIEMLQAARKRGESLWDAHVASDRQEAEMIQMAGFSSRVIRLAGAVAHGSLKETEKVLGKPKLSDEDVALLIIHYSDDISRLDKWVEPAEIVEGQKINELDRRMIQNENNPYYQELNEEGRKHFGGETTYRAQRRIGHLVEDRLATLLSQKSGESIDPKDLPEIIDNLVRAKIEETPLT